MKNLLQDCEYTLDADKNVDNNSKIIDKYCDFDAVHYLIFIKLRHKISNNINRPPCLICIVVLLLALICSTNGKTLQQNDIKTAEIISLFRNKNSTTTFKIDQMLYNGFKTNKTLNIKSTNVKENLESSLIQRERLKNQNENSKTFLKNLKVKSKHKIVDVNENIEFVNLALRSNNKLEAKDPCVLGEADSYLSWWLHKNGSLVDQGKSPYGFHIDLSSKTLNSTHIENVLQIEMQFKRKEEKVFISMANMNLTKVPLSGLLIVQCSVHYLSLYGNNFFIAPSFYESNGFEAFDWAYFPTMDNLVELDLRNCAINYLNKYIFKKMPQLKRLYLAHNRLSEITSELFHYTPNLVHIDISYNDVYYEGSPGLSKDPYERFVDGLVITANAFSSLSNVETIDFSKTKISPISARAFANLGKSLKHLSLCYTGFPLLNNNMFNNTKLRILDLSGNPTTSSVELCDAFSGLQDTLEVLFYKNSNVKYLKGLDKLKSLKILHLGSNIINVLNNETFSGLPNLAILDLSKNHINNWYTRVFKHNHNLELLNLRQNNINLMSQEMLQDFHKLRYLAIGKNNFVCNCRVRDFTDIMHLSTQHNPELSQIKEEIEKILFDDLTNKIVTDTYLKDIEHFRERDSDLDKFIYNTNSDIENMNLPKNDFVQHELNLFEKNEKANQTIDKPESNVFLQFGFSPNLHYNDSNKTSNMKYQQIFYDHEKIDFNKSFVVIDYSAEEYNCVESKTGERIPFHRIEPCPKNIVEKAETILKTWQIFLIAMSCITLTTIISIIVYRKWFYLKYCLGLIKNAFILSCMDKEVEQFRKRTSQSIFLEFSYDVFISYCDDDRTWVLEELLPNIEKHDISACLHERDFVVGMSILDNIVYCMDRSKVLLLVVSNQFLSRRWCQFEMHLAQYRLLETMRDRLILVMLENIPRSKRPKTLRYLMATKTYIQWPTNVEEQGIFWKRLKKSLALDDTGSFEKSMISLA